MVVDAEKKEHGRERKRKPLLSEGRSSLKMCLTGSALLEMSGNPTNQELTSPLELRCDVPMLRRLWQRIVERHRRNIADLVQIEMEMAK